MARHFTKSELEEIARGLATKGIRDSDFPATELILSGDFVAIVQGGVNRKLPIDKFIDLISDIIGAGKVQYNTTAYWNSQYDFVPEAGEVIVYSDYRSKTVDGETVYIPGIKVGSGNAYIQDLMFVGQEEVDQLAFILSLIPEEASSSNQLADKNFVVSSIQQYLHNGIDVDDDHEVVNGTLIFTRG